MFPATATLATLAIASLSLAQTSTVTLYIPGFDTQSLVASIVGSDASLTTYALQCAPTTDSDSDGCGIRGGITVTENSVTAKVTLPAELDSNGTLAFTGYMDCSLDGTKSAVCVESFGGTEANFPGITTETYTGTDLPYMPVVITAGAAVSTGSSPSSAVPSTTTSGTTATHTSGSSTKTSSSGGSSSGTAQANSSGTSTSTAGGSAVTGNSGWVLGGALAFAMIA